ncbi:unnamed protein product [Mesocestoides corti]|uniref:LIM zinc-binding domain-containing protein n=1 Tax=Mesocestoides corti TaxID=53468 RepID=A0A0R3UHM2_MESCO|nr:unnamed protein product [Mesocestoides corti]
MVERCAKCGQEITGQVVIALGQKWHQRCFVCQGCHTTLQGKQFVNKDGEVYCIDCRKQKFDPRCHKCHLKIDPTVRYPIDGDRSFHRECFVCSKCGTSLDGRRFCMKDDQYVCTNH